MADKFLIFRRFQQEENANDLIQKLQKLNIHFEVEDSDTFFDPFFVKNSASRDISIKLKPADIPVAQKELENYYGSHAAQADSGYYLFEFTDEELYEIIEKPDEWSDFDYELAQKILQKRGKEMNAGFIANLQNKRHEELAKHVPYHMGWIYFGYFSAFAGGLFGIIIGWYLCYSKKKLADGRSVYSFREWERIHGKQILLLASILLPIWLIIKIKYQAENF